MELKDTEMPIDSVIQTICKFVLKVLIAIAIFMLVVTWLQVFFRYIVHRPLSWSEELLRICLVWFGTLSLSLSAQKRDHVAVVIFKNHMSKPAAKVCGLISEVFMLVGSSAALFSGFVMVKRTVGQFTPALHIPIGVGYSAIPIAFALMTFYEIRNLIFDIKNYNHPNVS